VSPVFFFGTGSPVFFFFGQVHHTISTPISTTTPISTKIIHIVARFLFAAILAASAGCAVLQPPAAPPAAAPVACPPCEAAPPKPAAESARFEPAPFSALPGWNEADTAASLRAFVTGCTRPAANRVLRAACDAARAVPADDAAAARRFFESTFQPWRISAADHVAEGLVTGYYEPLLDGGRTRSAQHRYPVFGVPADLVAVDLAGIQPELAHMALRGRVDGRRVVPYLTRAEIERRGTAFDARVIAWVADPVELFFLQIQGSGQVRLAGGERLRLGFADHNGHPYRSLGRHLIDRGELALEQASMQGIKAWAAANSAKLQEALNQNPRYVFFREMPPGDGPVGALGAPLTAGYSIAIDPRFVPLGSPVFLDTTLPLSTTPLRRLMAAQDVGGAIRGAVRADFFWGTGEEAGTQAGRMRQRGAMWLFWPRGETPPGR